MTCATCGATIAEKAIVCYRCGAPTAKPAQPEDSRAPRGIGLWTVVAVVVLVVAAAIYFFTR